MHEHMSDDLVPSEDALYRELESLIDKTRVRVAAEVNSELVMLYWGIGKRIREEVLGGQRARYSGGTVERIAARLAARFGRGYSRRNLFRLLQFADHYPDCRIVSPLAAQLTWTNVCELLTIDEQGKRDFYTTMCAHEHWSKRVLRAKIDAKLYERTVHSAGGVAAVTTHVDTVAMSGVSTAELAFRDPYILDFLGLDSKHSEAQLEQAILDEMQGFLLELGADFCFVARQKRVIVDGADFYLDLLFYRRGMRCLVAIELKTRDLQPGDKGQMELYLRWLDVNERRDAEEPPIGLILC